MVNKIWKLCNRVFERFVPEDGRSAVIVPLYKGKGGGMNVRTIKVLAC